VTFPYTVTGDITLYAKWEAVVAPTYLINEDFEGFADGTLASTLPDWTLTSPGTGGGNQKVISSGGNNYLYMVGNTGGAELQHALPVSLPDILNYEVKFSTTSPSTDRPVRLYANSSIVVGIHYNGGKFGANNGIGASDYISDNTFPVGTWYKVSIECDLINMTYQVYIDDVLQQFTKGSDTRTVFDLSNVPTKIALVATFSTIYFDDIKVY
ncbi:MAG: hypothetical protein FWG54_06660, partial [Bacteroidetes bacterium]|nr:hypothetical protein [Bacteroidota bacterium]